MSKIHQLASNQEDTDTRSVLYVKYAALGFLSVVVRSPDSDIFCILLHHALSIPINIYMDVGTGKNRRMANIMELASNFGSEYCTSILGLYVFTGEDTTSTFKGMGKVAPLKKLQKNLKFQLAFW